MGNSDPKFDRIPAEEDAKASADAAMAEAINALNSEAKTDSSAGDPTYMVEMEPYGPDKDRMVYHNVTNVNYSAQFIVLSFRNGGHTAINGTGVAVVDVTPEEVNE